MELIQSLYDLRHTLAGEYLGNFAHPWEALPGIGNMILSIGEGLAFGEYEKVAPDIWLHKTAKIAPTASISGPCIVGPHTEIRHCAFIRGNALIGASCVVGNSTEVKNAILFDGVQVPHYNYVGDSILGYRAHMGAGAITSNVKSDKSPVTCQGQNTEMKKVGAMVGDHAEIGCGSVLNPGAVIGRNSSIYPMSCVRGTVPENCIYKAPDKIVKKN